MWASFLSGTRAGWAAGVPHGQCRLGACKGDVQFWTTSRGRDPALRERLRLVRRQGDAQEYDVPAREGETPRRTVPGLYRAAVFIAALP